MGRSRETKDVSELALLFSDFEVVLYPDGTTRKRKRPFDPNVRPGDFIISLKPMPIWGRKKDAQNKKSRR